MSIHLERHNAKMLKQHMGSDQNENSPAGDLRLLMEAAADRTAQADACNAQEGTGIY